jgi:hypothetical protein
MKRRSTTTAACLVGLLCLSFAPHAAASKNFPEALRKKLGLAEIPYAPQGCQLCHQNDDGGTRTATKPFGRTVLRAGAVGGSVPSLLAALNNVESDGTDSDHDGVGDIDELKAGTDPNVAMSKTGEPLPPGPAEKEIPLPETGCSLSPGRLSSPAGLLLLLGAALWLLIRRRPIA